MGGPGSSSQVYTDEGTPVMLVDDDKISATDPLRVAALDVTVLTPSMCDFDLMVWQN